MMTKAERKYRKSYAFYKKQTEARKAFRAQLNNPIIDEEPEDIQCPNCKEVFPGRQIEENEGECPNCGLYFPNQEAP